jgi:transcriptional regulator with XRE-family HTH domain
MPDSTPEREEIANRIRKLRKMKGMSLQLLAEQSDISLGYLSEIERGLSEISGLKLSRVAEQLGVSTDYLLSGRADASPGSAVQIPRALSEAAEILDLTYAKTLRLLAGKESLVARRSNTVQHEWTKEDWLEFYRKVERYL